MSSSESPVVKPVAAAAQSQAERPNLAATETEQVEREEKLLGKTINQSVRLTEEELAAVNTKKG